MSISEAFKYPFNNLPRVLMIAVVYAVYAMIIAVLFTLILNNFTSLSITILFLIVNISQILFLGGYGIRLIRSIISNHKNLPPLKIMEDIGRGIRIAIAGITYLIPLVLIYLMAPVLRSLTPSEPTREVTLVLLAAMLAAYLVIIPLVLLLGWAFQVAMFRYAVEGSGLFEHRANTRIVRQNKRSAFSLSLRILLLTIVYVMLNYVINQIYQGIVSPMMTLRTPQSTQVILLMIGNILSSPLNIISQFSGLHLLAQFGMMIGLGPEKPKPADPDMNTLSEV